ncbi:MAG: tryptophan--tRNA ligase [Clostridia bacterium]|nr:tryptophan--tRNA ligase [Clostridia bacterium]
MNQPQELQNKKTILSAVQPSGILTIGNYLGAIRNWNLLQEEYNCYFCVADLHAITVRQVPAELRKRTYEAFAVYMACGLDPERNTLFVQSHVPCHAELAWVLNCYTMFGELSRMTQFKDKSARHSENINAGLFTYPALMAADILLYGADYVPVGQDQLQHIELARDVANRFNNLYSDTFVIPEGLLPKAGAKVMSLADPTKKMSKSDENPMAYVSILDPKDVIVKKFKRAVTDSGSEVKRGEDKAGINNLITIYSAFTGKSPEEVEKEFEGQGYGAFKMAVGETVADTLAPVQDKFNALMGDKPYLESLMKKGSEQAYRRASKTLSKVYRKVGFAQVK